MLNQTLRSTFVGAFVAALATAFATYIISTTSWFAERIKTGVASITAESVLNSLQFDIVEWDPNVAPFHLACDAEYQVVIPLCEYIPGHQLSSDSGSSQGYIKYSLSKEDGKYVITCTPDTLWGGGRVKPAALCVGVKR